MTNEIRADGVSPFACHMDAIKPEQREQHLATARRVFHAVESIRELPNGYAFHLPGEPEMLRTLAEFISLERLCCPFFGFTVEIEPEGGPVRLQLTGREGVKQFIRAEIGEFVGESLTRAGDFR
jgi:hypothetical protein